MDLRSEMEEDFKSTPIPSDAPFGDEDIDVKEEDSKKKLGENEDLRCKWSNCLENTYNNLGLLIKHVNNEHLSPQHPVRNVCLWEGCPRYDVEQPSRFALVSHCRTHTGEKPYFCPIPECEKHFTRSDALGKHVKGVHDLHVLRDAVSLNRDRVKKGRMEANFLNQENVTEQEFLQLIESDYELRVPWWFSNDFLNILGDSEDNLNSVYRIPLPSKQYKLAIRRYESHYLPEQQENIEEVNDLYQLRIIESKLLSKLNTANKVNKLLESDLRQKLSKKRKLWLINQILLDNNLKLNAKSDDLDDELLDAVTLV